MKAETDEGDEVKPDGRHRWEWQSHYKEVWPKIRFEAVTLSGYLLVFGLATTFCFAWQDNFEYRSLHLGRRELLVWLVGSVGGTTYAIKWLMHSVGNGFWHEDRFLWRVFVPWTAGIYALVVVSLLQSGMVGAKTDIGCSGTAREFITAFLGGYFADGVSGLLTNVANALFGKVDKKE